MSVEPAEVFLRVFEAVPFPYLVADLALLAEALTKPERSVCIRFPLPNDHSRRSVVVASLRGLLRKLDVPFPVAEFMTQADSIVRSGTAVALAEMAHTQGAFAVYEDGDELVWEEEGLWPVAYSVFFKQLIGLYNVFAIATAERRTAISASLFETMLSEYPRQMPTQIHYAVASLGAWLGAPTNFQYFSFYVTQPQLSDRNSIRPSKN